MNAAQNVVQSEPVAAGILAFISLGLFILFLYMLVHCAMDVFTTACLPAGAMPPRAPRGLAGRCDRTRGPLDTGPSAFAAVAIAREHVNSYRNAWQGGLTGSRVLAGEV